MNKKDLPKIGSIVEVYFSGKNESRKCEVVGYERPMDGQHPDIEVRINKRLIRSVKLSQIKGYDK